MTTRRLAIFCSFVILLSAPVAAQTVQSTTGSVTGYLWTANNTPIEDAVVQLRNVTTGTVEVFTRTGRTGEFLFAGVPPGHYVVECVGPAQGSVVALGQPFTLAAGETVATFVRVANALPIALPNRSLVSISAGIGWTRDLTVDNGFMPGATAEVTIPIGPGQWVVIEGAWYQQSYQGSNGAVAKVRRGGVSVAGRLGSVSHRGVFGQMGFGVSVQDMTATGASRDSVEFGSGLDGDMRFTLTPGIGVDVGFGGRLSWRSMAEFQVMFQTPRDRWFNPQFKTGLAITLGSK